MANRSAVFFHLQSYEVLSSHLILALIHSHVCQTDPCGSVVSGALWNELHLVSWLSVIRSDWTRVVLFCCILRSCSSELYLVCVFSCTVLFVSISQVIGCEDHLWSDLDYVGWDIILHSNTNCLLDKMVLDRFALACAIQFRGLVYTVSWSRSSPWRTTCIKARLSWCSWWMIMPARVQRAAK